VKWTPESNYDLFPDDDPDIRELQFMDRRKKQYMREKINHPHPQDPNNPDWDEHPVADEY